MSDILPDYIARQLRERVARNRVVIWYDPRNEFRPFVDELLARDVGDGLADASVDGIPFTLATGDGSFYALRSRLEPLVSVDDPPAVVVYLPSAHRDPGGSALMELELAGTRWEPQLRHLARNALRLRYTEGVVDRLLDRETVNYGDIVAAIESDGTETPSMLKPLLQGTTPEAQIASWLADPRLDGLVLEREGGPELASLIAARLGKDMEGQDLAKWRSVTARNVLVNEFLSDLLDGVPDRLAHLKATSNEAERNSRIVARTLRASHPHVYIELADRAQRELGIDETVVDPLSLGSIDTFRFEEVALLERCAELVAAGAFAQVGGIARARRDSYWLHRSIERQAQWQAIALAADLGATLDEVEADLLAPSASPAEWVEKYETSWYRVDRAQRHFEGWLARLDDDPDTRAVVTVRDRYDAVIAKMAEGFVAALEQTDWTIGSLAQTSIYDDVVRPLPGRVAYLLVDAMRFEMGRELADRLEEHGEVNVRGATSVLPSITPTGMAALMPGASADFHVTEASGRLVARVGATTLPDLSARKKYFAARVPSSVDLSLGEVQALSKNKLAKRIGTAERVVVRSQEIDFFGEGGFQARAIMDTVIENLARAIRKLAAIGVDRAVVTADHGHLYGAEDRDEAMRIDAPGGATVDLHRRCWIGRGGTTPAACIRVPARALSNDTDLDFVFPRGVGVFRAGGNLAFHHGGPSLQEMVIPVISVRAIVATESVTARAAIAVTNVPAEITNRIFSVKISLASLSVEAIRVQPVLMSGDAQAGTAGLAVGADFDRSTGLARLQPAGEATIGFVLDDDEVVSVRIVVLDPATDAELYRSPSDIPVRLGVS